MNGISTNTDKSRLEIAYNDLSETKKALLRTGFLEKFEHKAFSTFYKKLSGETPLKTIEKEYIAEYFGKSMEELFGNN